MHPDEKKIKSEDVSVILEDVKNLHAKHGAVQSQLQTIKMYVFRYCHFYSEMPYDVCVTTCNSIKLYSC